MILNNKKDWLVLGDLHIPCHNKEKMDSVLEYASKHKLKNLVLNGDIFDFEAIKSYAKSKKMDLYDEVYQGMPDFQEFINEFDHIVYVTGNHEDRAPRYLMKNADQFEKFLPDPATAAALPRRSGSSAETRSRPTTVTA